MKLLKFSCYLLVSGLFFSCGSKPADYSSTEPAADSAVISPYSSSAAVDNPKDSTHKFIRTADLRFRVRNVIATTAKIEDLTARKGGFVTATDLKSEIRQTTTTKVSRDSSVEVTHFEVGNQMTIRVPNHQLDSTLREIGRLVSFLDYRVIKADDVSLQLLSNRLTQKRAKKATVIVQKSIEKSGRQTSTETVSTGANEESADKAMVDNLSLQDQMKFSTINLYFYQRETVQSELIPNDKSIQEYEPGFFFKVAESVIDGWEIISTLFYFVLKLWALIAIGVGSYLFYRRKAKK